MGRASATLVERLPGEVREWRTGWLPANRRRWPLARTNHRLSVNGLVGRTGRADWSGGLVGCVGQERGSEAHGDWSDEGIFGIFPEVRGTLACTIEKDGDARIDGTTVDAPIWATPWRVDEDIAAAEGTWSEGRLNPLREPR